jgi:hypothetical protein
MKIGFALARQVPGEKTTSRIYARLEYCKNIYQAVKKREHG